MLGRSPLGRIALGKTVDATEVYSFSGSINVSLSAVANIAKSASVEGALLLQAVINGNALKAGFVNGLIPLESGLSSTIFKASYNSGQIGVLTTLTANQSKSAYVDGVIPVLIELSADYFNPEKIGEFRLPAIRGRILDINTIYGNVYSTSGITGSININQPILGIVRH